MNFRLAGFGISLRGTALFATAALILYLLAYQETLAVALFLFGPVSVLIHEVGHAWMARRFGLWPIQLEIGALEGRVTHRAAPRPRQAAMVLAAGPTAHAAWALLGLVASLAGGLEPADGSLAQSVRIVAAFNLLWVLGNLRPVGESDGAQLFALWLRAHPGVAGHWATYALSSAVIFAAGVALWPSNPVVGGLFAVAGIVVSMVAIERWWLAR